MSVPNPKLSFTLRRVSNPSKDEIDEIADVIDKAFESGLYISHFPLPDIPGKTPKEIHRIRGMKWIGPALINGVICIGVREEDGMILGVGIWSLPGSILGDTPEGQKYHEAFLRTISPKEAKWAAENQTPVFDERKSKYPNLWKDSYHLHMLATIPEARGTGVGGSIVKEMVKDAQAEAVESSLATHNQPNKGFYERLGFKTIWEKQYLYPDGDVADCIVMIK